MAEETGISWTDHTYNPWWGCTKIAPGCDNCYAAALDKRTGGNYWDPHVDPRYSKSPTRNKPAKWNEHAEITNVRKKVFCGSMMDWCDNKAPLGALESLWQMISNTPMLDWQLLTKRASRIEKCLPVDWYEGYKNVWLGVTAEDIKHGGERVKILKDIPAYVRFVSAEPLLEDISSIDFTGIDWIIIGGESGPNYRPIKKEWVESLIAAADDLDISVWFKQWGGNSHDKGGCIINGIELKRWPIVSETE